MMGICVYYLVTHTLKEYFKLQISCYENFFINVGRVLQLKVNHVGSTNYVHKDFNTKIIIFLGKTTSIYYGSVETFWPPNFKNNP